MRPGGAVGPLRPALRIFATRCRVTSVVGAVAADMCELGGEGLRPLGVAVEAKGEMHEGAFEGLELAAGGGIHLTPPSPPRDTPLHIPLICLC